MKKVDSVLGNNTKNRLYRIWANMKTRCTNPHDAYKYSRYGGRGITYDPAWEKYINFEFWALSNGYRDDLSLDRIDPDGNYCPSNCRWISAKQQCYNRSSNHFFERNGVSHSIKEWAELIGVSHSTIISRIKKGVDIYGTT